MCIYRTKLWHYGCRDSVCYQHVIILCYLVVLSKAHYMIWWTLFIIITIGVMVAFTTGDNWDFFISKPLAPIWNVVNITIVMAIIIAVTVIWSVL